MNKLTPISIVISAFNEEKKLPDCLESVKWAGDIIVIDNSSTDNTIEIAKKYTPNVFSKENSIMLNTNKNFGFTKAKHEWILNIDADERITPELAEEIKKIITDNTEKRSGYWIPRKNIIFGKWIRNSIWWPDYQLRLFRKGTGKFPEKHVHEKIELEGETGIAEFPMVHLNYETISQFLYKMDKIYTENEAKNIINSGRELKWYDAIRMPVGDFLKTFFLQKGYKDGVHGLVLSFLQAFYAEVTFAKVWEKKGFQDYNSDNFVRDAIKEFSDSANEIHYWMLTALIDEIKDTGRKFYYKVLRKNIQRKLKK
jgi:(heptosyl)LPS beta-1,4-glucosyltransferase